MGMFDQLAGQVGTMLGGSEGGQAALMKAVLQMLSQGDSSAGLAGLVKGFQANGLGDIVSSWVSTGPNLPISAQQLQQGLGMQQIQQFAAKAGLSPDAASGQLANLLPGLVDKLTPEGKIPDAGGLEQVFNLLKGKLG
ncbi:MAG: YidB family protein [Nitrospiraceae bacterium]